MTALILPLDHHDADLETVGGKGMSLARLAKAGLPVPGGRVATTAGEAVALAEDWIRGGRCKRVIVVSADNVTSDNLMEWIGAGFLASGAAATSANSASRKARLARSSRKEK